MAAARAASATPGPAALTLVQTSKVTRFPIVLFGTEYWKGLVDWLRDSVVTSATARSASPTVTRRMSAITSS